LSSLIADEKRKSNIFEETILHYKLVSLYNVVDIYHHIMFKSFRQGYYNYLFEYKPQQLEEDLGVGREAVIGLYTTIAVISNQQKNDSHKQQ
jgi:hypothetical protein